MKNTLSYLSTNNTYDVFIDPDNSSLSDDKKANVRKSLSKFNVLLKTKRLGYFGLEEPKTKDTRVSQAYKKRVYHMLVAKHVKAVRAGLGLKEDDILIPFSSQTKQGLDELWNTIEGYIGQ